MSKAKNAKRAGFIMFHDVMERIKEFPTDKGMFIILSIYEASKAISEGLPAEPLDISEFKDKWMGITAQNLYDEVVRGIKTVNDQYNFKVSCGAIGGEHGLNAKEIKATNIETLLSMGCSARDIANVKGVSIAEVEERAAKIQKSEIDELEKQIQETAERYMRKGLQGTKGEIAALIRPYIKAGRKNMMANVELAVGSLVRDCENLKKHLEECAQRYQY